MMTLAELGVLLRGERVRCGFSVDEVASRLKITSRVVRSIEEGDQDGLPHAVYARGFIRAYAVLVGMSEEEIRPALMTLVDPDDSGGHQTPVSPPPPPTRQRNWLGSLLIVLAVVIVIFLLYVSGALQWMPSATGFWSETVTQATPAASKANGTASATPVQSAPKPIVAEKTHLTSTPALSTGLVAENPPLKTPEIAQGSPAPGTQAVVQPARVSGNTVVQPSVGIVQNEAEPVRTSGFSPLPDTATMPQNVVNTDSLTLQNGTARTDVTRTDEGKHQVILTALEECWVHSSADGTDIRQFSIRKGDVFALSFENKLSLKLGNAGGVRIKYDGKELPAPGTMGQVKTLVFPPAP